MNILILYDTVSYIKLNFDLKIHLKIYTVKIWKKFGKPEKYLNHTSGNPVISKYNLKILASCQKKIYKYILTLKDSKVFLSIFSLYF